MMFPSLIKALRPHQWSKNLIIFAPLLFSQKLFIRALFCKVLIGFLLYCLVCGGVYLVNDLFDLEADRRHPLKRERPLAKGQILPWQATVMAIILNLFGIGLAYILEPSFSCILLFYLGLNLAYSLYLKHLVLLDVLVVSIGFVLRAWAGALIIKVEISPWLVACTLWLALILALGKRRHELLVLEDQAPLHRPSLNRYTPTLLNQLITMASAATLVTYGLYTLDPRVQIKLQTSQLYLTLPLVIFGIFRYLYIIEVKREGGSPSQLLLNDPPLLINALLWLLLIVALLYC